MEFQRIRVRPARNREGNLLYKERESKEGWPVIESIYTDSNIKNLFKTNFNVQNSFF